MISILISLKKREREREREKEFHVILRVKFYNYNSLFKPKDQG